MCLLPVQPSILTASCSDHVQQQLLVDMLATQPGLISEAVLQWRIGRDNFVRILRHVLQAALDALRVGSLAACHLNDAGAAAGMRQIAFAGFSMLPELLQQQGNGSAKQSASSRTAPTTEGSSGRTTAAESASAGDGSEPVAADPGSDATPQWRPDSLAWLDGVAAQAASCYAQAAAAYAAALPVLHADVQMRRFVRERLGECHAAAGDWAALQRLAADDEQVMWLIIASNLFNAEQQQQQQQQKSFSALLFLGTMCSYHKPGARCKFASSLPIYLSAPLQEAPMHAELALVGSGWAAPGAGGAAAAARAAAQLGAWPSSAGEQL